jgi:hypothetical protein
MEPKLPPQPSASVPQRPNVGWGPAAFVVVALVLSAIGPSLLSSYADRKRYGRR